MTKIPTGLSVVLAFLRQRLLVPLALTSLAAVFHFFPASADALEFGRSALAAGQLWRLFSGHLVHFGLEHFVWDAAAMIALSAFVPPRSVREWLFLLGGSAFAISSAVWLLEPQFQIYRGLSGLGCVLFGVALVDLWRVGAREGDRMLALIAVCAAVSFLAKTGFEFAASRTVFVSSGSAFEPVPLAHLVGFACGAASTLAKPLRLARSS